MEMSRLKAYWRETVWKLYQYVDRSPLSIARNEGTSQCWSGLKIHMFEEGSAMVRDEHFLHVELQNYIFVSVGQDTMIVLGYGNFLIPNISSYQFHSLGLILMLMPFIFYRCCYTSIHHTT